MDSRERDDTLVAAIENWRIIAAETVDEIGVWRGEPNEAQYLYWRGQPDPTNRLWAATSEIVDWLVQHRPQIDPKPIQRIYSVVQKWYADGCAYRIPRQECVLSELEAAIMLVNAILRTVTAPRPPDESLLTVDEVCRLVGWSKSTFANSKSKYPLPVELKGDAMSFEHWEAWLKNFAKASKKFPTSYAECKRRLSD